METEHPGSNVVEYPGKRHGREPQENLDFHLSGSRGFWKWMYPLLFFFLPVAGTLVGQASGRKLESDQTSAAIRIAAESQASAKEAVKTADFARTESAAANTVAVQNKIELRGIHDTLRDIREDVGEVRDDVKGLLGLRKTARTRSAMNLSKGDRP